MTYLNMPIFGAYWQNCSEAQLNDEELVLWSYRLIIIVGINSKPVHKIINNTS